MIEKLILIAIIPALLLATVTVLHAEPLNPAEWSDGIHHFAFDGVFYSYANPSGQGIKLWVPPGDKPVRGIILFGNPGGGLGGDTRANCRQRDLLEFAARHNFGVAGMTGFPARDTYEKLGQHILTAFREWGRHGVHPELENTPFIFSGSSNAGVFSFEMMSLVPERTICITPNVGPRYTGKINEAVRNVPAWMHVGASDPFFPYGVEQTETLFAEQIPQGALWTWEAEMKGHENRSSDHVDMAFWDELIKLRLSPGTSELRTLDRAQGWIADVSTWDYDLAKVFPFSEAPATGHRGWLPNEAIARLYQSAASRTRQLNISFLENQRVEGGRTSGTHLSAAGNQLVAAGESITIRVKPASLLWGLETIEFYDRDEKIGEINAKETLEFTFAADDRALYAIHARGQQRQGNDIVECISNPLCLVVRLPALSATISAQLASVDGFTRHKEQLLEPVMGHGNSGSDAQIPAVFSQIEPAADDKISGLWNRVSPTGISDGGKQRVSALYGKKGLYLLFETASSGVFDFHLASLGAAALSAPADPLEVYATPALNSLLRHALQIAFDPGENAGISVNYWSPWDMENTNLLEEHGGNRAGIWIDRETVDGIKRAELFLPWATVGNPGFSGMPPGGTCLATVMGYNAADQSARTRWPHGNDPWAVMPGVLTFGEIQLQALVKANVDCDTEN